ncbi:MAG: DUF2007 domain-containing protein [Anaerolineae bacterium]|jgi:hypothetical protein|nr:DUF2007 domain-containing protein [Anaerolineae bacterium]
MVVYVTHNIHEAHIVVGRLQSDGIPAMLHQVPGASAMGITIGPLGEIKVLVNPDDYEAALDALFPNEPDALSDDLNRMIFDDDTDADDE